MPEAPKRPQRLAFARIAVPKPQHVLAEHLRESILKGEIGEGESLPSERELVIQTGLSRGAVREALRTLAGEGLVKTRQGRFGGYVVTLPGNDSMATAINRFVQGRRLQLRTLQETREALEPFLARLAAERRGEADLNALNALHAELQASVENFQEFSSVNIKWHNLIARASGNELLAALLYSLSHGVHVATTAEEYDTAETRKQVIQVHTKIMKAITAGNGEAAERGMKQHISATHARPRAITQAAILLSQDELPLKARTAVSRRNVM